MVFPDGAKNNNTLFMVLVYTTFSILEIIYETSSFWHYRLLAPILVSVNAISLLFKAYLNYISEQANTFRSYDILPSWMDFLKSNTIDACGLIFLYEESISNFHGPSMLYEDASVKNVIMSMQFVIIVFGLIQIE